MSSIKRLTSRPGLEEESSFNVLITKNGIDGENSRQKEHRDAKKLDFDRNSETNIQEYRVLEGRQGLGQESFDKRERKGNQVLNQDLQEES